MDQVSTKKKLQHINVKMLLLAKIFERTFKKSINLLPQHDFTIKGFTIHFRPRQKKINVLLALWHGILGKA